MQRWLSRYPSALFLLVGSTVLMVSGFSLLWPLVTIYVHTRLHLSMTDAGLILLVQALSNLFGNLVGGHLYDAWGGRRTIVTGSLLAAVAAFGMALTHSTQGYILLTVALGVGTGLVYPSIYAFAATVWPEGGRAAFNAVYVASNVGVSIGSVFGGLLAQVSFPLSFSVTGGVFLAYMAIVAATYRGSAWQEGKPRAAAKAAPRALAPVRVALFSAAPILLAAGMFLDWSAYVQWQTSVAVHMQALGFPLSRYSLLWTVNGVVILLGQPLVSWLAVRVPRLKVQMLIGNALFIASFLVLIRIAAYSGFLVAMVLASLGEMLVWPLIPAAADLLAPEGRRGFYQGLMSGAASAGRGIGPLLGGILYDHYSTPMLFSVMTGLFVLGFFVLSLHDRMPARRTEVRSLPQDG